MGARFKCLLCTVKLVVGGSGGGLVKWRAGKVSDGLSGEQVKLDRSGGGKVMQGVGRSGGGCKW